AVVADHHRLAIAIELGKARRHAAHRHRHRTLDQADFQLPGLAHIEQQGCRLLRIVQTLGELCGADLAHGVTQKLKPSRCGASLSIGTTVSKMSSVRKRPSASQVTRRAFMTGASPTKANRRPPTLSCSSSACGTKGRPPDTTMTS